MIILKYHTREQARRATEMHPQMTAEAEKMLNKLRVFNLHFVAMYYVIAQKQA